MKNTSTLLKLYTIRRKFNRPVCADIEGTVRQEMKKCCVALKPEARIAVAVGSRGIANLERIVQTLVACIREAGSEPFIVPAMGSHGSATAQGQADILAGYGITEKKTGAKVVSSMEVVGLGTCGKGNRVFMDKAAYKADGVIIINRIKPHTDFHGSYESGLVKMAALGLGKHAAAVEIHSFGIAGLRENLAPTFEKILETGKILCGIALIENAYDETMLIEAVQPADILHREPELLDMSREHMPRLPTDDVDVLIVDRMGKDVSGVGLDPNVIGRIRIAGQEEPQRPRIKMIAVCNLTPASHGNALGIGLSDVITRKLYRAMNYETMAVNVAASRFLERIKIPFIAESDAEAFAAALAACGRLRPGRERIVRILDTLHCAEVQVSRAIFEEIKDTVDRVNGERKIFDKNGKLFPFTA